MGLPPFAWVGALRDASGHADELRGFLRVQEAAGHAPAARSLKWGAPDIELDPAESAQLDRQEAREIVPGSVVIHEGLPRPDQPSAANCVNVARAMFETDRLPKFWLGPLLARDEVWVPCAHNRDAFIASGLPAKRIRVVGGTLDFDRFAPGAVPPRDLGTDGRFTFLTTFDFSARKGWEVLLRAWGAAFTKDDGVALVLKTGSFYRDESHVHQRIRRFLQDEYGPRRDRLAPIRILQESIPAADMPGLYAGADAYVLASRGEGWGRPYMEALAMGLPTIASAWGGNTAFMDPATSWLVDGKLIDVPVDAELFNDLYTGHRWFDPDHDALVAALRDVAGDPAAARAKAAGARPDLIARFGPEATAATLAAAGTAAVARHGDRTRPRVLVRGAFGGGQSLAVVNDGLAEGLAAVGYGVDLCPPRTLHDDTELAHAPVISHSWPHDFGPSTDGPTVVYLPWEYGIVPASWVRDAIAKADRVWAPAETVRDGFLAAGMPPGLVEVVPYGIDLEQFTPDGPARELPASAARAGCVFLFVGGTLWRKGIDLLLGAWLEAFGPDDDVALVVKDFGTGSFYAGQTNGSTVQEVAARPDAAPIVHLTEDLPHSELPALYRAADVVVTPYRGEGFCLPALEAMACERAVIHTGPGPTGEFVPADAGWAVDATRVPLEDAERTLGLGRLAGTAHVLEIDHDGLVAALREAAGDAAGRRARAAAGRRAAERMGLPDAAVGQRAALDRLLAEDLPLARSVVPAVVDGHAELVAYAPDWADEDAWAATLAAWAAAVRPEHPITLALLPAPGADPDGLGDRIVARLAADGIDPATLPDLALCRAGVDLAGLIAAARAVLVDPADAARPALVRRAARVLHRDAAELRAYRDGVVAGAATAPRALEHAA